MIPPERRNAGQSDETAPFQAPLGDTSASGRDSAGDILSATDSVTFRAVELPDILREDIEDAPFWKEVVAFANMPQSALDPYFGRFIAVYNGDIVDSDRDEGALALRFYRTFGYVPVYIHEVGVEDNVIDIND